MHEIKFLAYIKSLQWLIPVERICFDCQTVEVDLTGGNGDTGEYGFDEVELMQFTGLRDKNDKEIYEGYICKSQYFLPGEVIFKNGSFLFCDITQSDVESVYPDNEWEVIGNKFENPELLGGI